MSALGKAAVWLVGAGLKVLERGEYPNGDIEKYKYDKLPADTPSIRLLKMEPGGPRLRYSLKIFPLDEAPPFHALSYTWGDPFSLPNHEISSVKTTLASPFQQEKYKGFPCKSTLCNHQVLFIGLNLYEALARLSHPEVCDLVPHGYIWADAICINQGDPLEQQNQILLMGRIYSRAATVIAWLGEELEETAKAVSVINKLSRLAEYQLDSMRKLPVFTDTTYVTLGIPVISYAEWRAFFGFGRRGWFERVWILQEIFYANSHVYLAGSHRIAGEDLYRLSTLLVHSGWARQIEATFGPEVFEDTGARPGAAAAVYQMKEQAKKPGLLKPTNILASTRGRKSSDPLDYVYAMLNIIAVAQGIKPESLPIQPVREARLSTVLEAATLLCIRHDQDLTVLSAVQEREARPLLWSCPSWTVDWTKRMQPFFPLSALHLGNRVWKPSGSMVMERPDTSIEHVLKFRAGEFCTVVDISCPGAAMIKGDMCSLINVALSITASYKGPSGQSLTEAIWRTCLADTVAGRSPAPHRAGRGWMYRYIQSKVSKASLFDNEENFRSRYRNLECQIIDLHAKDARTDFPIDRELEQIAEAFFTKSEECASWAEDILFFMESFTESMSGRRFAVFSQAYVGLVPQSTKKDDTVWIIPGMKTPFALRRMNDGTYTLLGEAYVHGYMFGEACNAERPLKFKDIELR